MSLRFSLLFNPRASKAQRRMEIFVLLVSGMSIFALGASVVSSHCDQLHRGWLSLLGLSFPLALGSVVLSLLLSLLFARRQFWIPLIGLALMASPIRSYLPLNFKTAPTLKESAGLRILSYNTHNLDSENRTPAQFYARYFSQQHPDIIALQECPPQRERLDSIFQQLQPRNGYRMFYCRQDEMAMAVISKHPILSSKTLIEMSGNAIMAHNILLPTGDTLLFVNVHLRSNVLSNEERQGFADLASTNNSLPHQEKSWLRNLVHIAHKISQSAQGREKMTQALIRYLDAHRQQPTIVCGDFNDTPISRPYQLLSSQGLTDAYRSAGCGFGRSFRKDRIVVRIDHIFASPRFEPIFATIDQQVYLSDHYPIIADFRLR